jgi:hypothetical protein
VDFTTSADVTSVDKRKVDVGNPIAQVGATAERQDDKFMCSIDCKVARGVTERINAKFTAISWIILCSATQKLLTRRR